MSGIGFLYAAPFTMPCTILGPGLVGSYLGIAAQAGVCIPGPSGRITAHIAKLPRGEASWQPRLTQIAEGPILAGTRCHTTIAARLGRDGLAAQNGLGQNYPVAVCFFALDIDASGAVYARGKIPRLVCTVPRPRWNPVIAAWRAAGIQVDTVSDIRPAQWEKAILNATLGPLCLATGRSLAEIWADPHWRQVTLAATREGIAIAHAEGIAVAANVLARASDFFDHIAGHRPSVLKNPGEIPFIIPPLLHAAQRHHVPTPALTLIHSIVYPRAVRMAAS